MQVTINIFESELDKADLAVEQLEQLFWEFFNTQVDPDENLGIELNVKVYDR